MDVVGMQSFQFQVVSPTVSTLTFRQNSHAAPPLPSVYLAVADLVRTRSIVRLRGVVGTTRLNQSLGKCLPAFGSPVVWMHFLSWTPTGTASLRGGSFTSFLITDLVVRVYTRERLSWGLKHLAVRELQVAVEVKGALELRAW